MLFWRIFAIPRYYYFYAKATVINSDYIHFGYFILTQSVTLCQLSKEITLCLNFSDLPCEKIKETMTVMKIKLPFMNSLRFFTGNGRILPFLLHGSYWIPKFWEVSALSDFNWETWEIDITLFKEIYHSWIVRSVSKTNWSPKLPTEYSVFFIVSYRRFIVIIRFV